MARLLSVAAQGRYWRIEAASTAHTTSAACVGMLMRVVAGHLADLVTPGVSARISLGCLDAHCPTCRCLLFQYLRKNKKAK